MGIKRDPDIKVYEPLRVEGATVSEIMVIADDVTGQVISRERTEENESRLLRINTTLLHML